MRRTLILGMVVAGILFGISLLQAEAAQPVLLTADRDSYLIGLHLDILDDPDRKLIVQEVSSPSFSERFRPSHQKIINFAFHSSCHWLRFTVVNGTNRHREWVLEFQDPGTDHVDLFAPESGGGFSRRTAGDALPMKEWEIRYRFPSFRLLIPPGETRTFFMRLESSRGLIKGSMLLSTEEFFHESARYYTALFALFAGGVAIVILYNLMFWATLRERVYLYYVLSTLFIALFISVFSGWAYQFLWPGSPVLGNILRMVFVGLMLFWSLLFAREFLKSREYAPYLDYLARAIAGLGLAVIPLSLVAYNASIALVMVGLAVELALFLVLAVKGLLRGHRYAFYFLAPYLVFVFGLAHGLLAMVDVLPATGLGLGVMTIGLPITLLILSLAMADRYTHLQREYARTLEDEVSQRTEELNEALSELAKSHEVLELKVQERTAELAESNAELMQEIEERIKAEEMLEEAHFQLEERARACLISEERFRSIFETAEDYIFIKNTELTFTHINPALCTLLGMPQEDAITKRTADLFGAEYAEAANHLEERVLKGETVETEYRVTMKDWPLTLSIRMFPMRYEKGDIVGICGIARDVSGRRQGDGETRSDLSDQYSSGAMDEALQHIHLAAAKETTVLFLGESGSGKDYWARYLHDHSQRSGGPFFAINCAALASELVESELFGHEAGAFTGAIARKRGLLELAEGGTLLLNEIGDMPLPLQAKLLTFLDTRSISRVGGERAFELDVRIVAATNRDLAQDVKKGGFREDLFHRLNVLAITIPPLSDRLDDLPHLVRELLDLIRERMQLSSPPELDRSARAALAAYRWPGNVRELSNVLERAVILSEGRCISEKDLRLESSTDAAARDLPDDGHLVSLSGGKSYREEIESAKKFLVSDALNRTEWNVTMAAKLLGISRGSMQHHIQRLGIERQ